MEQNWAIYSSLDSIFPENIVLIEHDEALRAVAAFPILLCGVEAGDSNYGKSILLKLNPRKKCI